MTLVAPRPLEGVLVLDLTRETAGPFATMLMADMGAVVIKVEDPDGGDPSRSHGPTCHGESAWFLALNRNKRSLAVDITTPEGASLVRRLALQADVLVEDFSPGIMDALDLGYTDLKAENPRLVYVSVTGFGQDGPEADAPACDLLLQAMGGVMSLTGAPAGESYCTGVPQADLVCGLLAMQGALLGLLSRHRTDKGQHVDVAALDGQVAFLSLVATAFLGSGEAPTRGGNAHPTLAPYEIYRASDASFALAVGTDEQFEELCEAVGLSELAADERFATAGDRTMERTELNEALAPAFRGHTAEHWVSVLREAGVPAAPLLEVPDLLEHPQVGARGMIAEVEHPVAGRVRMPGHPLKLSATPARVEMAPPLLGEHSVEVLRVVLKMRDADIDDMLGAEVVRQQAACKIGEASGEAKITESEAVVEVEAVVPLAVTAPAVSPHEPDSIMPSTARSAHVGAAPSALVPESSLPLLGHAVTTVAEPEPPPVGESPVPTPFKIRILDDPEPEPEPKPEPKPEPEPEPEPAPAGESETTATAHEAEVTPPF